MLLTYLESVGVFFFCLSGALAGRQMKFDPWGVFVLALITGTGGGTLRSMLMGDFPVPILQDPKYILIALASVPCAVLFSGFWGKLKRHVSIVDAFGLGTVTAVGTQIGNDAGLAWWAAVGMGVVTATFGGVLRDIIRNDVPLIFRKEVYATPAMLGGSFCLLLQHNLVPIGVAISGCILFTAAVRLVAIRYAIHSAGK